MRWVSWANTVTACGPELSLAAYTVEKSTAGSGRKSSVKLMKGGTHLHALLLTEYRVWPTYNVKVVL